MAMQNARTKFSNFCFQKFAQVQGQNLKTSGRAKTHFPIMSLSVPAYHESSHFASRVNLLDQRGASEIAAAKCCKNKRRCPEDFSNRARRLSELETLVNFSHNAKLKTSQNVMIPSPYRISLETISTRARRVQRHSNNASIS